MINAENMHTQFKEDAVRILYSIAFAVVATLTIHQTAKAAPNIYIGVDEYKRRLASFESRIIKLKSVKDSLVGCDEAVLDQSFGPSTTFNLPRSDEHGSNPRRSIKAYCFATPFTCVSSLTSYLIVEIEDAKVIGYRFETLPTSLSSTYLEHYATEKYCAQQSAAENIRKFLSPYNFVNTHH